MVVIVLFSMVGQIIIDEDDGMDVTLWGPDKLTGELVEKQIFITPKDGHTYLTSWLMKRFVYQVETKKIADRLNELANLADSLMSSLESSSYQTSYRKKRNGSFRRIDEPSKELKEYQKSVVKFFEQELKYQHPEGAYAYIKKRNARQAVKAHSGSNIFFKYDLYNFFPSCTMKGLLDTMAIVYPFCFIDRNIMQRILRACMVYYDNEWHLPQGAPSSPFFSNVALVPFDFRMSFYKPTMDKGKYSRFADDIYLSYETHRRRLYAKNTTKFVLEALKQTSPNFRLNCHKTKIFNTKDGNTKMLGMTTSHRTGIKYGSKKKQYLKAELWTFLADARDGKIWDAKRVASLNGRLAYAKFIEPEGISRIIKKAEAKSGQNYDALVKSILYNG